MADTCEWAKKDPVLQNFHDFEWGRPSVDSNDLFEKLCLHCVSAGTFKKENTDIDGFDLSQFAFLEAREIYRSHFANFEPEQLANITPAQIDDIVAEEKEKEQQEGYKGGMNKNKQKLKALVNNAKAFIKYTESGKNFSDLCWSFTSGKVVIGGKSEEDLLKYATELSKALKEIGFSYTTPSVCLAFMKTVGIINAHVGNCPARTECMEEAKIFNKF